jgi:hypothetical protein
MGTKELNENIALIFPEDYIIFPRKVGTHLSALITRRPQY